MEIPHINVLKKDAYILKNNQLDLILDKIKKQRNEWSEKRLKKYNDDLIKLKKAHDNFVDAFKMEIVNKSKDFVLEYKKFNIINPQNIDCDTGKFSGDTIYFGFYIPKRGSYDRLKHYEAGIKKTPLEQVAEEMKPFGYLIKDTSDKNISKNVFVEIKFE